MQYKTIVLGFLEEEYPGLYERLRIVGTLLSEMERHASSLKRYHEIWMEQLAVTKPDSDPIQVTMQALELAIEHLRDDLPCESAPAGAQESLSLDDAMTYLKRATQHA